MQIMCSLNKTHFRAVNSFTIYMSTGEKHPHVHICVQFLNIFYISSIYCYVKNELKNAQNDVGLKHTYTNRKT